MKNKQLVNQRNGYIVSTQIEYADTWLSRLVGLLADSSLKKHEALWLSPCKSVHTIGMRFSIDVVFLDKYNRIKKPGGISETLQVLQGRKGNTLRTGATIRNNSICWSATRGQTPITIGK